MIDDEGHSAGFDQREYRRQIRTVCQQLDVQAEVGQISEQALIRLVAQIRKLGQAAQRQSDTHNSPSRHARKGRPVGPWLNDYGGAQAAVTAQCLQGVFVVVTKQGRGRDDSESNTVLVQRSQVLFGGEVVVGASPCARREGHFAREDVRVGVDDRRLGGGGFGLAHGSAGLGRGDSGLRHGASGQRGVTLLHAPVESHSGRTLSFLDQKQQQERSKHQRQGQT